MRFPCLLLALLLLCTACAPAAEVPDNPGTTDAVDLTATPVETPAPTATPSPTPTLIPTPTPPPGPLYKVRVSELNVRSSPSTEESTNILCQLFYEDTVYYLGEAEDASF